jgi:hypothetical protein
MFLVSCIYPRGNVIKLREEIEGCGTHGCFYDEVSNGKGGTSWRITILKNMEES